jgi:hypothetical protein
MSLITDFVSKSLRRKPQTAGSAYKAQLKVLKKLLLKAGNTQFGKTYHFSKILFADNVVHEFQNQVPLHTYSQMHEWWKRAFEGEKSVCWPGQIKYFALSSGTSEGASKYIPVTKQTINAITRASVRQLVSVGRSKDVSKDSFARHSLVMGGSTDLQFNGLNFSGDLSGITTSHVPFWYQPFTKPEPEIRAKRDWQEKINEITLEAKNWDVSIVAGVPAWVQILFERIIEHYQVNNIHDIWPNLSVYIHGGVSMDPYRKSIDKLCGKPLHYWETYLASEGFMAYQSRENAKGMKLILNSGIFFEFLPFNEDNFTSEGEVKSGVHPVSIRDVKVDVEYALLITTCSGAWRYFIGDVIKFDNLTNYEIRIVGRTKHYLSLCGEHLSVENMNAAVKTTTEHFDIISNEYTVAGIPYNERHGHDWYIGSDKTNIDTEAFTKMLDEKICELNDDYAVERKHALPYIFVKIIPNEWFNEFLKLNGKEGGQIKFPRVMKGKIYEDWKAFVAQKSSSAS